MLIAGERGGSLASRVFLGLGLGGLYTLFQNENLFKAWPGTPEFQPDFGPQHVLKGSSIKADATPEYLGVGYIIGPKVAGVIFAGGVFSWLVLMPLIYFFGKELGQPRLSRHHPRRADGPQPAVVHLHPSHGRGRSGRRRAHHAAAHPAHHRQRTRRRLQKPSRRLSAAAPSPSAPKTISPCAPSSLARCCIVVLTFFFLHFKPVPGA